jgi:hypothetical protein
MCYISQQRETDHLARTADGPPAIETIIAAHLLGVDPFDQPAVEEGKVAGEEALGLTLSCDDPHHRPDRHRRNRA